MKKLISNQFIVPLVLVILFGVTRLFIWNYGPPEFTEILYSYMPYAHLWASGVQPYLEQWYEYPPLTIPLFYLPHVIDMTTRFTAFHLPYLPAYRAILLLVDCLIFFGVMKALWAFRVSQATLVLSLVYYIGVTTKAHHFIYDSMDLTFAAAMLFASIGPLFLQQAGLLANWLSYFMAVALKYINAPLGLVQLLTYKKYLKRNFISMVIAGAIVWSVPLLYFRSSLLVSFEYHKQRGLQVESMPARLADTIGRFTQTESYVELYKNYDTVGPVSTVVKRVFDIVFPVSILLYVGWLSWMILRHEISNPVVFSLYSTLGYVLMFMITGKVLSTPFLLWHIPLVAALPEQSIRKKLQYIVPSALIIGLNMSLIPNTSVGIFSVHLFRAWMNGALLVYMFAMTLQSIRPQFRAKQ